MRRILVPLVAVLAAACAPSGAQPGDLAPSGEATVRIATARGSVLVRVAVADTAPEQRRGLQGVSRLAADAGMAFLFDAPSAARFWMKDTAVQLSIAFWGRDRRISAIMDMPPCRADPCPTYRPSRPFVGALEVHRGFFARNGVEPGDRIVVARG